MDRYRYELETVELKDLLSETAKTDVDRVFACDHSGTCRVGSIVEDIRVGLVDRLDERGREGWRLAHMDIHAEVVLCIWEKAEKTS